MRRKTDGGRRRRARTRKTIKGTKSRPRLVVFRSNRYLYAQLVDDSSGHTVVSVSKLVDGVAGGKELAQKAGELKIEKVVFDRAGYKYHGRVKKLAEAAKAGGLKF